MRHQLMKSLSKNLALPIGALILGLASNSAGAAVLSTFDSNADGWGIVSFRDLSIPDYSIFGNYAPTYNATGGNPGGYISSTDPDAGDFTFSAPSQFLGNQSGSVGQTLSYDTFHAGAMSFAGVGSDLILTDGTTRLLWRANPSLNLGSAWQTINVPLSPSAEWTVNSPTGALATTADFQAVLGNLTGLFIRGEYTSGSETAALDNVRLNSAATGNVPEPASALLLLGGLLAGGSLRRVQRQATSA